MSSTILESLVNSAGSIVASFSVALGLATLSTINNVSHEVIRLQEQTASIKAELSDIRNDFQKDLKSQEDQIKNLKERLDRIENKKSQVNFQGRLAVENISFQQSAGFTCRVCSENGGCRVVNCSEPHYAINS